MDCSKCKTLRALIVTRPWIEPQASPTAQLVLHYFGEQFKELVGEEYPASFAKDIKLLKPVLQQYGLRKTIDLITIFFEQAKVPGAWHSDKLTVGVFKTQLVRLLQLLASERAKYKGAPR